jgi:hypothetical protein
MKMLQLKCIQVAIQLKPHASVRRIHVSTLLSVPPMNTYLITPSSMSPPTWVIARVGSVLREDEDLIAFDTEEAAEAALARVLARIRSARAEKRTVSTFLLQLSALHAASVEQLAIADCAIGRSVARVAYLREKNRRNSSLSQSSPVGT